MERFCGVSVTLDRIGGKWKPKILWCLMYEPLRYGELAQRLSAASPKMLTQQLKALEIDGLVTRTAYAEIPPRVVYEITPLGRSLERLLSVMDEWGLANREKFGS